MMLNVVMNIPTQTILILILFHFIILSINLLSTLGFCWNRAFGASSARSFSKCSDSSMAGGMVERGFFGF